MLPEKARCLFLGRSDPYGSPLAHRLFPQRCGAFCYQPESSSRVSCPQSEPVTLESVKLLQPAVFAAIVKELGQTHRRSASKMLCVTLGPCSGSIWLLILGSLCMVDRTGGTRCAESVYQVWSEHRNHLPCCKHPAWQPAVC